MSVPADKTNRLAIKAKIKRASQQGRKKILKLDKKTRQELTRIYSSAEVELVDLIQLYAADDGNIKLQVLQSLKSQVNQRLRQLSSKRDELFGQSLRQAAEAGASAYQFAAVSTLTIADDALRFLNGFTESDGLQLSDRIWRIDRHAREIVTTAIEQAVIQGHSAIQAANDFISRGEPVPSDLTRKINIAQNGKISRIVGSKLMKKGSPYNNALRLFRTEINRAHGKAYQIGAEQIEGVIGTKFLLSKRHPETDICDMHARVNRYGLGAGVYPHGKSPWPAHPNTISFEIVVFDDEVTEEDKNKQQQPIDWLKQQSPARQQSILGKKKRAALWRGNLKQNQIVTPWNVLKKRYQAKGIDTDNLTLPSSALLKQSHVVNFKSKKSSPKGTRVNSILDPVNHANETTHVGDMIGKVHGDGVLPLVPIRNIKSSEYGHYNPNNVSIGLRGTSDHMELTLAHEIGHFLDHKALPGRGMSSASSEALDDWRDVTANSPIVKQLINGQINPATPAIIRERLTYLLQPEELWARTYAQYIATKSGSATMLKQLDQMRYNQQQVLWVNGTQWKDNDFEPISQAIDRLFIKQGWIYEPTK